MVNARRLKRLENLILQAVAPAVSHGMVDPRLNLVTVTHVRLSADLSVARINWSLIGDGADRSRATHALDHARGHLQTLVAKAMQTRTTPRLEFHYDASLEKAVRVTQILDDLAKERGEEEEEEVEVEVDPAEESESAE